MAIDRCKTKEREKSMANNTGNKVTEVWKSNLRRELQNIWQLRRSMQHVFFDTEFPGFLLQTARDASEEDRYQTVRFNVDRLKVIQLGITMSDGVRSFSWQFNLKEFDPKVDSHSEASVQFLEESGIDLEKNRVHGVDARELSTFLAVAFIRGCRGTKWVTFHGIYDIAYLLKLICKNPLPSTLSKFLKVAWSLFGAVYDVKYMARECSGAFAEVGLVRLAEMLGVKWVGKSHQAGHDSLLTAMAFWELKKKYADLDEDVYAGLMFGVDRHGLVQLNNVLQAKSPLRCSLRSRQGRGEILLPCIVPVKKMYGNSMSGYCDVHPPPCSYYGYQPFHDHFGPAMLIQVPFPVLSIDEFCQSR